MSTSIEKVETGSSAVTFTGLVSIVWNGRGPGRGRRRAAPARASIDAISFAASAAGAAVASAPGRACGACEASAIRSPRAAGRAPTCRLPSSARPAKRRPALRACSLRRRPARRHVPATFAFSSSSASAAARRALGCRDGFAPLASSVQASPEVPAAGSGASRQRKSSIVCRLAAVITARVSTARLTPPGAGAWDLRHWSFSRHDFGSGTRRIPETADHARSLARCA